MIKTELVETKCISRPKGTYTEFEQLQWVANKTLPPVDSEVTVKVNGIGVSKVLKYFVEHGFIGLVVQPIDPPEWYRKQNASTTDSAGDTCQLFTVTDYQVFLEFTKVLKEAGYKYIKNQEEY